MVVHGLGLRSNDIYHWQTPKSNNKKDLTSCMCLVWCFYLGTSFPISLFKFYMKSCDVKHFCDKDLVSILHCHVKMFYLLIDLIKLTQKIKKPKPTTRESSNGLVAKKYFSSV